MAHSAGTAMTPLRARGHLPTRYTPPDASLQRSASFSRMKSRTRGMICSRHLRPLKMP